MHRCALSYSLTAFRSDVTSTFYRRFVHYVLASDIALLLALIPCSLYSYAQAFTISLYTHRLRSPIRTCVALCAPHHFPKPSRFLVRTLRLASLPPQLSTPIQPANNAYTTTLITYHANTCTLPQALHCVQAFLHRQALRRIRSSWHTSALAPPRTSLGADTQTAIRRPALRLLRPCRLHRVHLHIRAEAVAPNHTGMPTTGHALAHRHSAANVRTLPESQLHSVARSCVDALGRTRAHRRDRSFHRTTCDPRGPSAPRTIAAADTPPPPATCARPTRSADTPTPTRPSPNACALLSIARRCQTPASSTPHPLQSAGTASSAQITEALHIHPRSAVHTHRRGARLAHMLHHKCRPTGTDPYEPTTAWAPRCRPIRV